MVRPQPHAAVASKPSRGKKSGCRGRAAAKPTHPAGDGEAVLDRLYTLPTHMTIYFLLALRSSSSRFRSSASFWVMAFLWKLS